MARFEVRRNTKGELNIFDSISGKECHISIRDGMTGPCVNFALGKIARMLNIQALTIRRLERLRLLVGLMGLGLTYLILLRILGL
ncbi:hypothetical protein APY04_0196 [Hyphomicrobium sulfonivorans]|uniref:Uncharacterized protein n=1 Tax=Hyphomicrobium sulfonivorans TaxID=121290 RepID=A0A120CYE1_HYPSL|nr:hypothetical protein [Hyphomicrobium sulfonivorans]KWT72402.1 hypothetical protein APY04_0196 [Hyphomicrobium sulfonivorans]